MADQNCPSLSLISVFAIVIFINTDEGVFFHVQLHMLSLHAGEQITKFQKQQIKPRTLVEGHTGVRWTGLISIVISSSATETKQNYAGNTWEPAGSQLLKPCI